MHEDRVELARSLSTFKLYTYHRSIQKTKQIVVFCLFLSQEFAHPNSGIKIPFVAGLLSLQMHKIRFPGFSRTPVSHCIPPVSCHDVGVRS